MKETMNAQSQYFDLQVNGYAGVDFNGNDLTVDGLHFACQCLREDGVAGVLATIITDEIPLMTARLKRIVEICHQDSFVEEMIRGIHIEGPFINPTPGFVGAHPPQAVQPASIDIARRLLDAAGGMARLVTLAPEYDSGMKVTEYLATQHILVAAGHCDPSIAQLQAALDAGLSLFTHLGNGCPMLLDRHDNIIQRALSLRDRLTICFIADGAHIPPPALGNYLRLVGVERSIVVTDAIAAARLGPGRYTLGSQTVDIGDDLVARSADRSHLVGSTATMPRMAALLAEMGFSADEISMLTCKNPRRLLGQTVNGR